MKKPKLTKQQIVALQRRALELYAADESHAKELGKALLQVKAAMKHGEFNTWWKSYKLSQNRVSYCIRLAQGKVAAAKIRRARSPERMAESAIREKVSAFLKFAANEGVMKTLNQLNDE